MLRNICMAAIGMAAVYSGFAQDSATLPALKINGSVDAYYRFNFNNTKDMRDNDGDRTFYNNATSFTNSHNSFEPGMASVKLDYTSGKVTVVADMGFGRRAEEFSYNETGGLTAIKQAYIAYSLSGKVRFTMGKFGTHVGYEMLDPQLNRNYSMSYMFSYGPFFHSGLKADFSLSENVGFMIGVANPTDHLSASFQKKSILAQIHGTFGGGKVTGYLNYLGGKDLSGARGNQIDAVVTGKVSDKFSIGYNGTVKMVKADDNSHSWWASALYLNLDPTSKMGVTLRGEYFDDTKNVTGLLGTRLMAGTLTLNIRPASNLRIMPELRLDSAKGPFFFKNNGNMIKSTGSFILAAVVSF